MNQAGDSIHHLSVRLLGVVIELRQIDRDHIWLLRLCSVQCLLSMLLVRQTAYSSGLRDPHVRPLERLECLIPMLVPPVHGDGVLGR